MELRQLLQPIGQREATDERIEQGHAGHHGHQLDARRRGGCELGGERGDEFLAQPVKHTHTTVDIKPIGFGQLGCSADPCAMHGVDFVFQQIDIDGGSQGMPIRSAACAYCSGMDRRKPCSIQRRRKRHKPSIPAAWV